MQERFYDVIISPIYTEKAVSLSASSKHVFKVAKKATKPQVKMALEKIFGVKLLNVNILNTKSKTKVFKGRKGERKAYRKAIVTLAAGQKLDFNLGVKNVS